MKKGILIISTFVFLLIFANYIYQSDDASSLKLIASISLNVPEPSGLCFDEVSNTLWTVSDENSTVYNIDRNGKVIKSFKVNGIDLEGIGKINDSTLVTILERDREVVIVDTSGKELNRFSINLKGEPNKGLEGVVFDRKSNRFFILNEKKPCLLVETDKEGKFISKTELKFAPDLSGIDISANNKELWITSDEAEKIYLINLSGKIIKEYKINIEQVEGIAVNQKENHLYIISDPLEKLYIFSLPL